ncbi:hypothetical protein HDE_13348 [Halotydeus destructor]|nr:hypothetical protein HDE_13348 [Halotydeus destructor]
MSEKYFTDLNDAILYDIISRSNLRTQMVHKWSRDDRIRKLASMDDWKRTEFDYDTIARQLNIGDVNGHGLQMMFNLLECSDNLQIIRCNRGHLSSHLFDLLSTSFQHLEVLDISHQALSDHQLDLVTAGHPGLKEINISSCLSLTDNAIKSLFSNCRCLEKITADDLDINGTYLNLLPSSCTSLSLLSSLDMNNIVKLACSPAQLSQLSIQFNTLVYVIPEFPLAFKSFSSLVKLTIVYGACCNEVRFLGISRLTKLKNLTIMAATHKFLNEDLVTIATSVPELEQLSVRYMNQGMPTNSLNDETLRFVTSSLKHLRILRIENAEDVTGQLSGLHWSQFERAEAIELQWLLRNRRRTGRSCPAAAQLDPFGRSRDQLFALHLAGLCTDRHEET